MITTLSLIVLMSLRVQFFKRTYQILAEWCWRFPILSRIEIRDAWTCPWSSPECSKANFSRWTRFWGLFVVLTPPRPSKSSVLTPTKPFCLPKLSVGIWFLRTGKLCLTQSEWFCSAGPVSLLFVTRVLTSQNALKNCVLAYSLTETNQDPERPLGG